MYSDRALRKDDVAAIVSMHHLPHAASFIHAPSEERMLRMVDDEAMRGRVIVNASGEAIGFFALSVFEGWLAEIHGIVVAHPRMGVGRWALREAMRWAFADAGVHRLWLEVVAVNAPARALYLAEGLTHEGTFRDGYASGPGLYEDLAHYGILKDEWQQRR